MAQVINTNVASLTAQRNLNRSQNTLNTSLQRLSSGLRINSAKDDAAGMAISTRMTSQINGLNQATRNASDGISLAQTAEGALGTIADNLQRMRELSVQAANGTLSDSDRDSVNSEITQLKNEIDRVANQTSFNGTNLLDGSKGGFTFQVGADANQTISISSLTSAKSDQLGTSSYAEATGAVTTKATYDAAGGQNLAATNAGTTAGTSLKVGGFTINGVTITGTDMTVADNTKVTGTEYKSWMAKNVDAINVRSSETGVTAQLNVAANGDISISLFGANMKDDTGTDVNAITVAGGQAAGVGLSAVDGTAGNGLSAASVGFDDIDVSTVSGANKALTMLDGAIDAVNTMRGDLGAVQNRFESTITNLATSAENLTASRSRIQDTDFASETANLTKSQILQQAGTAMLAQAKSLPQQVLSLLQ